MKSFFAFSTFIALIISVSAQGQGFKVSNKGNIDVSYTYNDPSAYFSFPKEKCFPMNLYNFGSKSNYNRSDENGLYNLSSAAIRFRAFVLMGDLVTNPLFIYSLNKEVLRGEKHFVNYSEISKYKDLVKRYNAIRPVSLNAVVGMGLNPENMYDFGAYAFFNIRDNDIIITAPEKAPYCVPGSSTWGEVMKIVEGDQGNYEFRTPDAFTPSNVGEEKFIKIINKTDRVSTFSWAKIDEGQVRKQSPPEGNIYLKITWPTIAIDEIYEQYEKYESGKEKPPSEQVNEELAGKDLSTYTKNDEWSQAFEDDLKDVEAYYDYDKNELGLRNPDRTIVTFDWKTYQSINKINNTQFFNLTNRESISCIVDKRGNKQIIGGTNQFNNIRVDNEGNLSLEIYLSPAQEIKQTTHDLGFENDEKLYFNFDAARRDIIDAFDRSQTRAEENAAEERRNSKGNSNDNTMHFVIPPPRKTYSSINVMKLSTDKQLKILKNEKGYVIKQRISY